MVRILVDGVIYSLQEFGGISRYFSESITHLQPYINDMQMILHLPANCRANFPKAQWIRQIKDINIRPQKIFGTVSRNISKTKIKIHRPQIFHSTYYTLPYWQRLKTVVTVHDYIHEKFPALLPNARVFIERKKQVIEDADYIIAVSESTKQDILTYNKIEESKINIVYPGINETFQTSLLSEKDVRIFQKKFNINGLYWLFVGRRGHYKNFGTLLRAFVRIAPKTDGYLVAIGGESKLEPWQVDLLIKNRLERRVRLLHSLDDEELKIAYKGASAFIFPSLAEGFGIPLVEAMATGTPIIASDIPVFHEVAKDAAFYFDSYNENMLAEMMIKTLDEKIRENLIINGKQRSNQFSWDTASRKLAEIYKNLV